MIEHGTVSTYNNQGCRCEDCRAAIAAYRRAKRGGESAKRPGAAVPVPRARGAVEWAPEPAPEPIELQRWEPEREPLSFRRDPSARRAAVRGLMPRRPPAPRVDPRPAKAEPAPEPEPGPGLQLARFRGEPAPHTYQAGRVTPGGGFVAQLSCGHFIETPAPLSLNFPCRCPVCNAQAYRTQTLSAPEPRRRWGRR
jgi:hypothetical protein